MQNKFRKIPFYLVCDLEYDKIAQLLIQRGADINHVGFSGTLPLLEAAKIGDEKTAQILIEKGANVNATDRPGESALNLAAANGMKFSGVFGGSNPPLKS